MGSTAAMEMRACETSDSGCITRACKPGTSTFINHFDREKKTVKNLGFGMKKRWEGGRRSYWGEGG